MKNLATITTVKGKRKATLHFHPGQSQALESTARFTFVVAGTQSGKTSFAPWWLAQEMDRCGEGDYIAATATYDLFKLKFLPEMQSVFVRLLGFTWVASDRVLLSPDGKQRIILRSANAPEALESATGKAAVLDECGQDTFRLEAWEAVQRRLSIAGGRVLGVTTPYNLGWLKTEVYDRWERGDRDYRVIQFRSTMNPVFPVKEYERARATLPSWKFEMFYNGEFSRPAGMIYGDFTDLNVTAPFVIPPEWPRYCGLDFGAVNTAIVWIAEDPGRHTLYLYREYLEGGRSTVEHAREFASLSRAENVVQIIGGARSESQQRMDWQAAGVMVNQSPIIDVEAGIDRVTALFKTKRLFVFSDLRGLRDELGTYARKLDHHGQPTDEIKDKQTFHRLDSLRYAVSGIEQGQQSFVMRYA